MFLHGRQNPLTWHNLPPKRSGKSLNFAAIDLSNTSNVHRLMKLMSE